MPTGRHNVCFATGRKKGLLAIRQAPENARNLSTRSARVSLYL